MYGIALVALLGAGAEPPAQIIFQNVPSNGCNGGQSQPQFAPPQAPGGYGVQGAPGVYSYDAGPSQAGLDTQQTQGYRYRETYRGHGFPGYYPAPIYYSYPSYPAFPYLGGAYEYGAPTYSFPAYGGFPSYGSYSFPAPGGYTGPAPGGYCINGRCYVR